MAVKKKTHWGSTLDDFLKEEGIYEEAKAQVAKETIAWQIEQAMKKKGLYYGTSGMDLPILFRMKPDPKNRCWKGWEAVRVTVTIHG